MKGNEDKKRIKLAKRNKKKDHISWNSKIVRNWKANGERIGRKDNGEMLKKMKRKEEKMAKSVKTRIIRYLCKNEKIQTEKKEMRT